MSIEDFITQEERIFARFIDQMFTASGKRSFNFIDILHGVQRFDVPLPDWKKTFDQFVKNGWLISAEGVISLGPVFDYLSVQALQKHRITAGLDTIAEICRSCLGPEKARSNSLPEQVKILEEILGGKRTSAGAET